MTFRSLHHFLADPGNIFQTFRMSTQRFGRQNEISDVKKTAAKAEEKHSFAHFSGSPPKSIKWFKLFNFMDLWHRLLAAHWLMGF